MRVLLVDDDALVAEVIAAILEDCGAEVHICQDAQEALAVKAADPDFDLVISDMKMPGISGIEFCGRLRHRGDETPFILLSGDGRDGVDGGPLPDACVLKGPDLQKTLISTISELLPARDLAE